MAISLLPIYHELYSSLFPALIGLGHRGVRVAVREAERERTRLAQRCRELLHEVEADAERPLHSITIGASWFECEGCGRPGPRSKRKTTKVVRHKTETCPKGHPTRPLPPTIKEGSSISQDKLKEYIYGAKSRGGLGLPVRKKKGKVTTDEAALRALRLSYPERCGDVLGKVLEFRRTEKLGSFIAEGVIDADGRIRSQYKLLVATGRLSASSNPRGTGANLQNTDAKLMFLLRPDRGKFFLRADLSQAEHRVVCALTGVKHLIEEARSDPRERDCHTEFAAKLFSAITGRTIPPIKGEGGITSEQRYLSKRGRHGYNYGLTAIKLAEVLLKEGPKVGLARVVTIEECEAILATIAALSPEIDSIYHRGIRDIIRQRGILRNSWGAEIDYGPEFRYATRVDQREEIFRKGYSWIPQGEVGRLMNQYGVKPLEEYLNDAGSDAINLQRHDEVVVSVDEESVWRVARFIRDNLERERLYTLGEGYPTTSLLIPVEFMLGRNGGKDGTIEFKRLPERDEFETKVGEWLTR